MNEPTCYPMFLRSSATVTKREDRAISEAQARGPMTREQARAVCVAYNVPAKLYSAESELVGRISPDGRVVIG